MACGPTERPVGGGKVGGTDGRPKIAQTIFRLGRPTKGGEKVSRGWEWEVCSSTTNMVLGVLVICRAFGEVSSRAPGGLSAGGRDGASDPSCRPPNSRPSLGHRRGTLDTNESVHRTGET